MGTRQVPGPLSVEDDPQYLLIFDKTISLFHEDEP